MMEAMEEPAPPPGNRDARETRPPSSSMASVGGAAALGDTVKGLFAGIQFDTSPSREAHSSMSGSPSSSWMEVSTCRMQRKAK